jgi:alcohol dehydrogenase, propanol-preferring
MHAMILDKPGTALREAEIPAPVPRSGQVKVRIGACAACRTDLHLLDGELPDPKLPLVPGHEIVGKVVECASQVPVRTETGIFLDVECE